MKGGGGRGLWSVVRQEKEVRAQRGSGRLDGTGRFGMSDGEAGR